MEINSTDPKYAIKIENLHCHYGKLEAIKGITLSVPVGSVYAFLGSNGAGKTTTIKTLVNILQPNQGKVTVLGIPSNKLGAEEFQQIGYFSESQNLPNGLTVRQLLNYCKSLYPSWDDNYCTQLVSLFKLPLDRKIGKLSRGMKTKAALTSSLAYHPKLLLLDEPFNGLDPLTRDELIDGFLEITAQQSWSIFISSHDVDEVEKLADHVGIINEGKLLLEEPTESLLQRFKQISFHSEHGGDFHKDWINPKTSGTLNIFTDTEYSENDSLKNILIQFPDAQNIETSPLSLRDIVKLVLRNSIAATPNSQLQS